MKSFFVLCVLLGLSSQALGAILGANRCTWGPSYWCKNIASANECGAIGHCKANYWNQQVKDDTVCSLCKDGMEVVDGYLKQNGTQQEIEQALMSLCDDVPLAQLKQECKQLVSEDFVMIYDELLSIVGNADVVCSALGLCSASATEDDSVDALIKRLPDLVKEALANDQLPKAVPILTDQVAPQPSANKDCSDCRMFLTEVQNAVKKDGSLQDKWMKLVEAECKALGPGIDQLCTETVGEALAVFSDLNGVDDVNSMCQAIMMCNMKTKIVGGDDGMCTDCKNFFNDWKTLMTQNKTIVNQLNKLILSECQALGTLDKLNEIVSKLAGFYCLQKPSYMRKTCTRYVAMVIEVSLNRIAHEPSEEICQEIYFCDPPEISKVELSMASNEGVSSDKYCTDCTTFMADLQDVAKNNASIIDDLTDLIKEQCDALGPEIAPLCKNQIPTLIKTYAPLFELLCKKAADQIVPMVVDAIESNDVNLICSTILMCPAGSQNKPMTGNLCNDCIAFTQDWQAIAVNNKSIICNQVVSNLIANGIDGLVNNCSSFVKEYLPQLWDLIEDNDAETICSTVYLCLANEEKAEPVQEVVDMIEIIDPIKSEGVTDDKHCTDCTQFMKDLQDVAQNNQSIVTDLTNFILEQCDTLGIGLSEVDVNLICSTMLMCPSGSTNNPMVGNLCNDCVAFTQDWQSIIQNNKSIIDELTSMIAQQCSALGPDFEKLSALTQQIDTMVCSTLAEILQEECHIEVNKFKTKIINELTTKCSSFVKDYLPQLWDLIQYNDAETICGTMYMCMSEKPEEKQVDVVQNAIRASMEVATDEGDAGMGTCLMCKMVVHEVDKMLEGNTTEEAVVAALQKVCNLFSADIREECKTFVDTYAKDIVDLIINEVESGVICTKLMLCSAQQKQTVLKASTTCDICEAVATELDNLLSDKSTEAEITAAVEQVCSLLPAADQQECKALIDQYLDEIIQLLVHYLSPKTLCSDLGLCTSSVAKKGLKASTTCDICEAIATELDNLLSDKSTEAEITAAVEQVCSLLPAADQQECKALIDQYLDEIIQLLVHYLSPKTLCSDLGLCTSSVAKKRVQDSTTCEVCELVANELDSLLSDNSTEAEITAAVEKVCSLLPSADQQECKSLIDQYLDEIIQLLVHYLSPKTLCSDLGLCTSSVAKVRVTDSTTCELCQAVAKELEQLITKDSTEEEIVNAVKEVCGILPSNLKTECDQLIDMYGKQIINLLIQKVSPQEICSTLKLCSSVRVTDSTTCELCQAVAKELEQLITKDSTEEEIVNAVKEVCGILPSNLKTECDQLIDMYGKQIINLLIQKVSPQEICSTLKLCSSVRVTDSTTCELCQAVAKELEQLITKDSTEEEIVNAVKEVCGILPSNLKTECDQLIDMYGKQIINLLIQKVSPQEICSTLKLCSNVMLGDSCELCNVVMQEIEHLINSESTQKEIIAAVEKVCAIIPKYKSECDNLIEQYGDTIIELLTSLVSPEEICSAIGLCSGSKASVAANSYEFCEVCKLVMTELDNLLGQNATESEIITALEKVCSILPGDLKSQCDDFMTSNGKAILDLLLKEASPSTVCPALKMCPKSMQAKVHFVSAGELCTVCKFVIEFVDQEISANATEAEVKAALDRVCDQAPGELKQACDDLVNEYADDILKMLANIFDPDYVCLHLGLCKAERKQVLIGANPCTYGPAYWCQNEKTARECNALNHCQQHVWE